MNDFIRTPDGNQRIIDYNLKIGKYFLLPEYDAVNNPDIGTNENVGGYLRYNTDHVEFYNGSTWAALGGGGSNIYNSDGALTGDRFVTLGSHFLFIDAGHTPGAAFLVLSDDGAGAQTNFGSQQGENIISAIKTSSPYKSASINQTYLNTTIGLFKDASGVTKMNLSFDDTNGIKLRDDYYGIGINSDTYYGTNLGDNYFAQQKFVTDYFSTGITAYDPFSGRTTSTLTEGSNLYYTAARFNTAFASKSTNDLAEGSNLYFTNTRVQTYGDANYLKLSGGTITADVQTTFSAFNANSYITKNYTDNLITGISWKQEVRVATTANITLLGTQTIDGVAVIAGDRVLVKNQTLQTQNGIYIVAAGAWMRSIDADSSSEIGSATVLVRNGTAQKNTQWTCTNSTDPVIGTDNITFGQISGAGTYTNGTGLLLTGTAFSLDLTYTDARYLNQNTTGNAATATKWATGRTLSITGDVTYTSPSFDGSGNVSAAGTVAQINAITSSYYDPTSSIQTQLNTKITQTNGDARYVQLSGSTSTGKQIIQLTTEQLRLGYDGTNYATFTVSSGGGLTIAPTGLQTVISGNLAVGALTAGVNTSNLFVTSVSGATSITASQGQFGGSSTNFLRTQIYGATSTALSTGSNYSGILFASTPITTFTSGTHPWLVNVAINPLGTLTNSGATVTNTASLYLGGAGSGGTNNYTIYSASGLNQFQGQTNLSGTYAGTASGTQAGTIIGGGTLTAFANNDNLTSLYIKTSTFADNAKTGVTHYDLIFQNSNPLIGVNTLQINGTSLRLNLPTKVLNPVSLNYEFNAGSIAGQVSSPILAFTTNLYISSSNTNRSVIHDIVASTTVAGAYEYLIYANCTNDNSLTGGLASLGINQAGAVRLPQLTTNGFLKTSATTGLLIVDTNSYVIANAPQTITASQVAVVNIKYITNNTTLIVLTVPTNAASSIGDQVPVRGYGTGGWKLQNSEASTVIHGASDTTVGTAGFVASQGRYDTCVIEKIAANEWTIVANRGTLTIS